MENLRGEDEILEVLFAIGSVHGYTLKICTAQHEHVDMSGILSKLGEKQTRSAICCKRQAKSSRNALVKVRIFTNCDQTC